MSEAGEKLYEELMRFRPEGLTPNRWAVKAELSRTIWTDLRRHANPSRKTMEKLLGAIGMTLAEFEALRVQPRAPMESADGLADKGGGWRGAPYASIPLFDTKLAGQWGGKGSGIAVHRINRSRVVDKLERPAALGADPHAYAVTMVGKSMWPRFRPDRRLLVSPGMPVEVGDDVVVELAGGKVLIKELVRRTQGVVELRQFHPEIIFTVEASEIEAIHKVAGEAIWYPGADRIQEVAGVNFWG